MSLVGFGQKHTCFRNGQGPNDSSIIELLCKRDLKANLFLLAKLHHTHTGYQKVSKGEMASIPIACSKCISFFIYWLKLYFKALKKHKNC